MRRNSVFAVGISIFFMFLLSIGMASAATVYGNLYDLYLDKIGDVVVTIDTEPQQMYVSKNGTYAFDVPVGDYEIKAEKFSDGLLVYSSAEGVSVRDEGTYVLDMILFPNLEDEIELGDDIGVELGDDYFDGNGSNTVFFLVVIVLIVVLVVSYLVRKKGKKKSEVDSEQKKEQGGEVKASATDLDELIKVIKEEGGRTTQKEIRKKIPLSEAKISLMIAELEHNGKVEKIKKGRGNIIILR